jgi:hypothetical protein
MSDVRKEITVRRRKGGLTAIALEQLEADSVLCKLSEGSVDFQGAEVSAEAVELFVAANKTQDAIAVWFSSEEEA